MKHLSITRAIVSAAVSLHLFGLKNAVAMQDRRVNRAMARTDTATVAVASAQNTLAMAREQKRETKASEAVTRRERDSFVAAAVAEADSLRRQHTVGA